MALRLALDTNRYVDFAQGSESVVHLLEHAREVFVPCIVLAELRAVFRMGSKAMENERDLRAFLNRSGVFTLNPDEGTTHVYADLHVELRRRGSPVPTNDLWIASLVIQHDLVLLTRDEHFNAVPRLARL